MVLTQEKTKTLADFLTADEERAKTLLSLEPEAALVQINELGNDFTLEEIIEFGDMLKKLSEKGELDEKALDDVAGGVIPAIVVGYWWICFGVGAARGLANW